MTTATTLLAAATNEVTFLPRQLTDSWLEAFVAFGAALAFLAGLCQYARAQKWQRTQFLAEEVTRFRSHPLVTKAIAMLDNYNRRIIDLFPDEKDPATRKEDVRVEVVILALNEDDDDGTDQGRVCDAIRDCFDAFFDGLERLEGFMVAELINPDHLKPFVVYWVQQFADEKGSRKGADFVKAAHYYVQTYYFGEVENLCKRFGYIIPKPPNSQAAADTAG